MSEIEYSNFLEHNNGVISTAVSELESSVILLDNLIYKIETSSTNNREQERILQKLEIQKTRLNNAKDALLNL